jgi:hypothetical protein
VKLRFDLLGSFSGTLPAACQLPDGYDLKVTSGRDVCEDCGGRLRRVRSSRHHPVGLMLGRPQLRLIHQQCSVCGQGDPLEVYYQHVPAGGNYAYDLIVEVGRARFCDHHQDAEIASNIRQRWGLSLPASSIGMLAHSFLDGLAAVHQAHAPALRQRLAADGGYSMHVDGTCEADTDVLFLAIAEPRGWTLEAARMTTENAQEISKLMRYAVERFGSPLAVVRDLSKNIAKAKRDTIPQARDLICHYHFLENVGKKLCEKHHAKLETALRRLKVRSSLRSTRKDLVRWSRKGERLSRTQIDHLLRHPHDVEELDFVALRRFVAYALLSWLDDYKADLQGEYFPFDLPNLAFYRRGRELQEMMSQLVSSAEFPQRQLSALNTIARHLATLREDAEVVAVAARLEKAAALFEKLRKLLRLTSRPRQRLLRGRDLSQNGEVTKEIQGRLKIWRDQLQKRHDRERDDDRRADQAIVLNYLQKYEKQLVGHVIEIEGRPKPFVVLRTNNPPEHLFKSTKQGVRRKVGVKKLTRQVQAMRPEAFLVANLADQEYVNLVLGGSLANLPAEMAKQWDSAQAIRKQRLAPTTDHPIPITKKQIRQPQLLENIKQAVTKIIETITKKTRAA